MDSEFLHFADGDAGTCEILEYLQKSNEDSDDEEEPLEPEFNLSKTDAMAAINLLQKIVQHLPDLDIALPLWVGTCINSELQWSKTLRL